MYNFVCHQILYISACEDFPGSHTAVRIASLLRTILAKYGLEGRMLFCVTDNAANMCRCRLIR